MLAGGELVKGIRVGEASSGQTASFPRPNVSFASFSLTPLNHQPPCPCSSWFHPGFWSLKCQSSKYPIFLARRVRSWSRQKKKIHNDIMHTEVGIRRRPDSNSLGACAFLNGPLFNSKESVICVTVLPGDKVKIWGGGRWRG